jgi:polyphosphate kinase
MARNFFRRVETCFPVEDPDLKAQIDQMLEIYWKDNTKSREQGPDPTYLRLKPNGERVDAQAYFLEQAQKRKKPAVDAKPLVVKTNAAKKRKTATDDQKMGQPA